MEKTRSPMFDGCNPDGHVVVVLSTARTSVTTQIANKAHPELSRHTPCTSATSAAATHMGRIRGEGEWQSATETWHWHER